MKESRNHPKLLEVHSSPKAKQLINNLIIPETEDTPEIALRTDGFFKISGMSIPVDNASFYQPVLDWLQLYKKEPSTDTLFHFHFQYLDQKSELLLKKIFSIVESIYCDGNVVTVYWYFDDEDNEIEAIGTKFEEAYSFPIIKSLFVI